MNQKSLLVKNARIIDPANNTDKTGDILIENTTIAQTGERIECATAPTIDASGLVACPGFIDLHCHLREPGYEEKETIASGSEAAARGGFTTICCMPNTNPPLDNAAAVKYILDTAAHYAKVTVLPCGCITKARKGLETAELAELAEAGCMGFSDDGSPVASARVMRLAMIYSSSLELPVIDHCEELELSRDGLMNDGWVAARLGLKGIPAASEESMVARDIALASETGACVHITHISTRGSVQLIRDAKDRGLRVTADVTPHHITLTQEDVAGSGNRLNYDTNTKVNPPLRTANDIVALIEGLNDGTIDAIATDHAPHCAEDKLCEFELAAFGISGFETAFGSLMGLVHIGKISLPLLISCLTSGPARLLHKRFGKTGTLSLGSTGDLSLLDLNREWTVDPARMASKGKNTPLAGQTLKGKVMATIRGGSIAFLDDEIRFIQ
jgi:dihydroorotase